MRKRMVVSASKKRKNTYPCEQVLDKGSDEGQKIPRRRIKDSGKWEICKNELVAFQQKFGHVNVSSGTNSINQRLGNWAKAQRFQHKLFTIGKDSLMTQERVDQLEALKFGWSSTRQRDYTYLGPDWWKRTGRQTQVSLKRQDAQPGRNAIINAIRFGFGGFEVWMKYIVFHFILKMMLVPSFLSLVLKQYATLIMLTPLRSRIIWKQRLILLMEMKRNYTLARVDCLILTTPTMTNSIRRRRRKLYI